MPYPHKLDLSLSKLTVAWINKSTQTPGLKIFTVSSPVTITILEWQRKVFYTFPQWQVICNIVNKIYHAEQLKYPTKPTKNIRVMHTVCLQNSKENHVPFAPAYGTVWYAWCNNCYSDQPHFTHLAYAFPFEYIDFYHSLDG